MEADVKNRGKPEADSHGTACGAGCEAAGSRSTLAVVWSQLRGSGILVERMSQESRREPYRGGIMAAKLYAAPKELTPAVGRRGGYKDIAPTELDWMRKKVVDPDGRGRERLLVTGLGGRLV